MYYLEAMREYYEGEISASHPKAETIDDLREYRRTVDRFEEDGTFRIYYKLHTSIGEKMDPSVTDIWNQYGIDDLSEVVTNPVGLAKFVRACEQAREQAEGWREEKRVDELITLADFAIENEYGLAYP
ncbi:hypothetical protein [Halovivax limisalsi]|uniref:hypothetical protein n=1 Tax=Halovivax limisalsi TaxID=1453760 RepID=UPI001FFD990B|nr:hypothetical protein [Halovivax limisalsi]